MDVLSRGLRRRLGGATGALMSGILARGSPLLRTTIVHRNILSLHFFTLLVGVGDVDGGNVEDDMATRRVLYTAVLESSWNLSRPLCHGHRFNCWLPGLRGN